MTERAGYQREALLHNWEFVGVDRRDVFIYAQLLSKNAATVVAT